MARDLFLMVMEAEGDLVQPFDGGDEAPPPEDTAPPEQASPEPDGMDEPPPLSEDDALSLDDGGGGLDEGGDSTNQEEDENPEDGTKDGGEKLSDKANAVLNQKLYQQFLDRNKEIEEIVENLQKIVPLLPWEIVQQNDAYITRLKTALEKGKSYAIEKFVDSGYGENLLYFHKLDALYNLLEEKIDENLKKLNDHQ